mgnify:CR=1 FL=1
MNYTIFFTIASLFYGFLLGIVYFSKKRIDTLETKLYSRLILLNIGEIIFELICFISSFIYKDGLITIIINKIYLIFLLSWVFMFTKYVKSISNLKQKKYKDYILLTMYVIFALITIFGELNFFVDGDILLYSKGLSVDMAYFSGTCCSMLCIGYLLLNVKNVKNKKYIPLLMFIIGGTFAMSLQKIYPQLLLMTAMETFITFLMYFTIENPDMKLIAQLNEAKSQAEKANSAKTDFLSSMSHEIRTPLNAIVGFSQALSEEDIPDSAKEEVNDIISASESLLDIVNGILDISKIEANKLEIIDKEYSFKKVFDELVALTKARMGDKPLDFRYHYDETIPVILYGDNVRVKQVILNLLTNSVKYTKQGFVDFKVNSILKDDVCRLIISVEDSGIGIKKENIEKLFTKFERFDEKNTTIEGTGLGLAITKKLVNLMNGKIVVQSVYGKGSRFTIAIDQKIVKGKTLESFDQKTSSEFRDFDATGLRILVVDDNKLNLKVASRLLTNYKSEIITIDNGFEVIDRIKNGEKFDLILMDDMMPKMSGVETLHKLKEIENYNIPTIALTANAIEGMREKYLNEGFDDYLSKPIDKLELNKVINKYLNKN